MRWGKLAKNQPTEIAMFQISEVQEAPAFNGRRSFLTLRPPASVRVLGQITAECRDRQQRHFLMHSDEIEPFEGNNAGHTDGHIGSLLSCHLRRYNLLSIQQYLYV